MAFTTTQDRGPARGCHDRHGWMPSGLRPEPSAGTVHHVILRGIERGTIVADAEDRASWGTSWGTLLPPLTSASRDPALLDFEQAGRWQPSLMRNAEWGTRNDHGETRAVSREPGCRGAGERRSIR